MASIIEYLVRLCCSLVNFAQVISSCYQIVHIVFRRDRLSSVMFQVPREVRKNSNIIPIFYRVMGKRQIKGTLAGNVKIKDDMERILERFLQGHTERRPEGLLKFFYYDNWSACWIICDFIESTKKVILCYVQYVHQHSTSHQRSKYLLTLCKDLR